MEARECRGGPQLPTGQPSKRESESAYAEASTFEALASTPATSAKSPAKLQMTVSEERRALVPFAVISIAYLLFTITDGALRMIVLMHAYNKGFSAMEVAIMFTLYELAGVVTNLAAGLAGAYWGIRCTLVTGLSLQLVSYGLLFGWSDDWNPATAIAYVTVAQMFGGIAKDLTKLGGKTVTKLVTPAEKSTSLFKLVSMLTGWKNSLKGVGCALRSRRPSPPLLSSRILHTRLVPLPNCASTLGNRCQATPPLGSGLLRVVPSSSVSHPSPTGTLPAPLCWL